MVLTPMRSWPRLRRYCSSGDGPVRLGLAVFLVTAIVFTAPHAVSQDAPPLDPPLMFRDVEVEPVSGRFLVAKDVNIRSEPKTASARLGSLRQGTRVDGVGMVKGGAWLTVRDGGKDLGFVYAPVMLPLIDRKLDQDLTGKTRTPAGDDCGYTVHHVGRTVAEGEDLEISDYEIAFDCARGEQSLEFQGTMFLTEAPYLLTRKPIYQITVDVPDVAPGIDEVLSATSLYEPRRGRTVFDSAGPDSFADRPEKRTRASADVREALGAAIALAVESWSDTAWGAIAGDTMAEREETPEPKMSVQTGPEGGAEEPAESPPPETP